MSRIVFLILLSLFGLSPASAETAGTTIGNVTVELVAPLGFCKLDANNPADALALTMFEKPASNNQKLAIYFDCKELDEWRDHRRAPPVVHAVSYATLKKTLGVDIPTAPEPFIKQICEQMRQQGSKMLDGKASDMKARVEAAMVGMKLNEQRSLGIVDEGPRVCYSGFIQKTLARNGTETTGVTVVAGTLLKGKIIYLSFVAPYVDAASAAQLLERQKKAMAAFLAANPA